MKHQRNYTRKSKQKQKNLSASAVLITVHNHTKKICEQDVYEQLSKTRTTQQLGRKKRETDEYRNVFRNFAPQVI